MRQIRAAISDDAATPRYVETLPRRGYRFIAQVQAVGPAGDVDVLPAPPPPATLNPQISPALENIILRAFDKDPERRYQSAGELAIDLDRLGAGASATFPTVAPKQRWLLPTAGTAALLVLLAWLYPGGIRDRLLGRPQTRIGSLAILPLKSLQQNAGDDYLGLGIADAIITRISQIDGVRVRPTSAIRKYSPQEVDSLKAAGDLQVDAVLDGTVQRSGDRLRISVNLLRVSDGASLWSETFNASFSDIFTVQDEVSQQITSNLRLRLNPAQQARFTKRYTSNPEAYEYYLRGLRSITTYDRPELESGLKMLQRAVELDPNYALAHAQMAWAYTWLAVLIDAGPSWLGPARQSLKRANALDPDLAESHVVRHLMLWSSFEGYQIAEAIRELKVAQTLNPSVGHWEMGALYDHLGLLEPALREIRRALEVDPTSDLYKAEFSGAYLFAGKYEEAIASSLKLRNRPANVWAYLGARRIEEARQMIDPALAKNPTDPHNRANKALLLALEGKLAEAEAQIPSIPDSFRANRGFHHLAFNVACVYGLAGKPVPAVDWLRAAVKEGMPNYPLFAGDPSFDRIRSDPGFLAFLAGLKPVWEGYKREFQ